MSPRETPNLRHTFVVKNTTDRQIRILKETHSCTCVSATLSHKVLAPRESAELTLVTRLPQDYTKQTIASVLETDHPEAPKLTYQLVFESYPDIRVVPDRFDISRETGEGEIEIFALPQSKSFPTLVNTESPNDLIVDISPEPQEDALPGGVRRRRFKFWISRQRESKPAGPTLQNVTFGLSTGEARSVVVACEDEAFLESVPSYLNFGLIQSTETKKQLRLMVRSKSRSEFKVLKAAPDVAFLKIHPSEGALPTAAAEKHLFDIVLDSSPESLAGQPISGLITINTDVEECKSLSIQWAYFPAGTLGNRAGIGSTPVSSVPTARRQ